MNVGRRVARKRACANSGDVAHASPKWTNIGVARECV